MMKKVLALAMLLATTFFVLPSDSYGGGGAQERRWENRESRQDRRWDDRRGRRSSRQVRQTYGYRNYGQYRRTQVGNRRFRMVNRSYWNNGIRRTRVVRLYY
jgi:hypothetical protein